MKLYHATKSASVDKILANGFKDSTGYYMTGQSWSGVWFSDYPLTANEGAKGEITLIIEIPENLIKPYEWIEEGKPYREFMIPAELANQYGPPVIDNEW